MLTPTPRPPDPPARGRASNRGGEAPGGTAAFSQFSGQQGARFQTGADSGPVPRGTAGQSSTKPSQLACCVEREEVHDGRMKQTWRQSTAFAHEAAAWQIGTRVAAVLWWLPLLGSLALVAVFAAHRPLFDFLLREDSVIEWLSAAAFAAIATLAVVCAHR